MLRISIRVVCVNGKHKDSKTTREDGDKVARQSTAVLQPASLLSNTFKEVSSMQ